MTSNPGPVDVALYEQDRATGRWMVRRERLAASQPPEQPASYLAYDADRERHLVQRDGRVTPAQQVLTNAGLSAGQPVEFVAGNLDSTPLVRLPQEAPDPPAGDEARWALILRQRRYTSTVQWFFPPRDPIFSGTQFAQWFVTYYSANGEIPPGWPDTTYGPTLYAEGSSEELCGDGRPGVVGNFCRTGLGGWNFRPEPYVTIRRPGCHLSFARTVPTGFGPGSGFPQFAVVSLGGIVIGRLVTMASPDPPSPQTDLPEVFESVEGFTCEQATGAEVSMNWQPLQQIQLVPYSPPQLLDPGRPGGVVPVDRFETVFWGLTQAGVQRLAVVQDDYSDEDPGGIMPQIEVLPAVDRAGVIALDLRIRREPVGAASVTQWLKTVSGQIVASSNSWRRHYVNGSGSPVHPCAETFKTDPNVNLDESGLLLFQADAVPLSLWQTGGTVQIRSFRLNPAAQSCSLANESTVSLQVPPVQSDAVGLGPKDQLAAVGLVYFSEEA